MSKRKGNRLERFAKMERRKSNRMEPRTEIVKFRMTETEKIRLQNQAKRYHMNVSDYIRHIAARPPDVTREEFEMSIQRTIYEIHKIGVNINQIAKKYNENGYTQPSESLNQNLGEVYQLMYSLIECIQTSR